MSKHYDVVVLGAGIGALTTAALLARRSWRVLVLGHGHRPPTYAYDGITLARRPFTLLAGASPAWGRVLAELAQSQTFRRRTSPIDPMLQVLAEKCRLDLPPDAQLFAKEIDREFPGVRRVVEELYDELARTNAAADAAFEKDVVWPPGTFWERRETNRVLATLPHAVDAAGFDLLAEFPRDHAYRSVVDVPARFASDLFGALPPFAVARLQGAWTRGVMRLARGEDEISEFLVDRVRAHGGEVDLGDRAASIAHRSGRVTGVVIDGDDAPTGVQFVVSDLPTRALVDLATGFLPSRRALAPLPVAAARGRRFVVSIAARTAGVPRALAVESFLLSWRNHVPDVHLQRTDAVDGTTLLVAEAILEGEGRVKLTGAREAVLEVVQRYLPFVERHYVVVDSPHDGRPLWDFRDGQRVDVPRSRLKGSAGTGPAAAEEMIAQTLIDPPRMHGLAGEPVRAPLAGAFVVGRTVMPALGQEGELLAAWGAARLITRTDRRKEKMRRDMWSKVELG